MAIRNYSLALKCMLTNYKLVVNCSLADGKKFTEYGGKEVDLIIEDYKKNYITVEIKSKKGKAKEIFPLQNTSVLVTNQNYFDNIMTILEGK